MEYRHQAKNCSFHLVAPFGVPPPVQELQFALTSCVWYAVSSPRIVVSTYRLVWYTASTPRTAVCTFQLCSVFLLQSKNYSLHLQALFAIPSQFQELLFALTYLLTPCCRDLLEKLTGLQLVKKFPAFNGTRRFITALTSVHQLSLSWALPIQSIYPDPTSWRSILILSTHIRLGLPITYLLTYLLTYLPHGVESFLSS